MKRLRRYAVRLRAVTRSFVIAALALVLAAPAFAQANSPWENAVGVLQQAFTSTIARGLSLVAIVVSGLTFAFGEGGSKRVLAGVLFGVGMAIAAVKFNTRTSRWTISFGPGLLTELLPTASRTMSSTGKTYSSAEAQVRENRRLPDSLRASFPMMNASC